MTINVVVYRKPPLDSGFIPPFALWYILSLIYWRIMLYYLPERLLKSWLFFVLAMCVSILPCIVGLNYFSIARTISFFPYFLLGWLCKEYRWNAKLNNLHWSHKIEIVLLCVPLCYLATKMPSDIFLGCYPVGCTVFQVVLYKVLSWVIAFTVSITIYILMPQNKSIKEGQYTLFYYLFHTIMLFPIFDIIMGITKKSFVMSFVALIGILFCLYMLRKIPFLSNMLHIIK